jgi:hypothetical protein
MGSQEINMTKWITVKTFAPHVEMTKDQIYRLIREAVASPAKREEIFPFRFVRLGRQIRIDAASAGIFSESQNSKAQAQDEELKAAS